MGRYHSLIVDQAELPDCLEVSANSEGIIMGFVIRTMKIEGVQFHPESIMTTEGKKRCFRISCSSRLSRQCLSLPAFVHCSMPVATLIVSARFMRDENLSRARPLSFSIGCSMGPRHDAQIAATLMRSSGRRNHRRTGRALRRNARARPASTLVIHLSLIPRGRARVPRRPSTFLPPRRL